MSCSLPNIGKAVNTASATVKRHQRNGGGEGQAAGRQAQAVFTKALAQCVGRVAPGKDSSGFAGKPPARWGQLERK
jgi:hypothetical protein